MIMMMIMIGSAKIIFDTGGHPLSGWSAGLDLWRSGTVNARFDRRAAATGFPAWAGSSGALGSADPVEEAPQQGLADGQRSDVQQGVHQGHPPG